MPFTFNPRQNIIPYKGLDLARIASRGEFNITSFLRGVNALPLNDNPWDGHTPGVSYWQNNVPDLAFDYYFTRKGMNVNRLGIDWLNFEMPLGAAYDSNHMAGIMSQVIKTTSRGAWCIVDIHNYWRRRLTENGTDYKIGEGTEVPAASYIAFCTYLATTFKGMSKVAISLMNEPYQVDTTILVATYNAAQTAMRAAGFTGPIFTMASGWGEWSDANKVNTGNYMLQVNNEGPIECHFYVDPGGPGNSEAVDSSANYMMGPQNATTWARANGRKLFLGEFATPRNYAGNVALKTMLDFIEANKDVWVGWAWWGAGSWPWGYSYLFRLDPAERFDDNTSPFYVNGDQAKFDAKWTRGIDMPQMAVLDTYLGNSNPNMIPRSRAPYDQWDVAGPWDRVSLDTAIPFELNAGDGYYGPGSLIGVREDATNGEHYFNLTSVSPTVADQVYTFSAIVKPATRGFVTLLVFSNDFSSNMAARFRLSDGFSYNFEGGGQAGTITGQGSVSLGNGEWMIWLSGSYPTAGMRPRLMSCLDMNGESYQGVAGTTAIYVENVALYAGAFDASKMKITDSLIAPAVTIPVNTVAPTVTGTAEVGSTLTCAPGTWTGTPTPTFTYQWQRGTTNISGATSSTYVVVSGDVASTLRCQVTGSNRGKRVTINTGNTVAVVAATPFVIANVPGMIAEFKPNAYDASTGTWANTLSAGNAVQGTSGSRPTAAASGGGITCTSTQNIPALGVPASADIEYGWAVVTEPVLTNAKTIIGASVNGRQTQMNSNGYTYINRQGVGTRTATANVRTAGKRLYHWSFIKSTTVRSFVHVDGDLDAEGWAPDNNAVTANQTSVIGGRVGGGENMIGSIHYLAISQGTLLTLADRQKVEGRLAWDHGIQSQLPSAHPYKNSAPPT